MADWVRVTPGERLIVRDPQGRILPAAGEVVDRSRDPIYWARRERAGDVTIIEATEPSPIAEALAAPAEE